MTDPLLQQALDALVEAQEEIASWGAYADSYYQKKHKLAEAIAACGPPIAALRERMAQHIPLYAAPPVTKGMQLVPVEPEEQDIQDALDAANLCVAWDDDTDTHFPREFGMAFYRAMLASAKETP